MPAERGLTDSPARYGAVTRALHAITAALVIWQFVITALYKIFGESPGLNAVARLGPHGYVGFALLFLALARIGWALGNADRRPQRASRPAAAAHAALYGLLIMVPLLALARLYAKGEGWMIGPVWIIPPTGQKIEPVIAVADLLHGPLSWTLLALVAAHSLMAALHGLVWKDGGAGRMFGTAAGWRRTEASPPSVT